MSNNGQTIFMTSGVFSPSEFVREIQFLRSLDGGATYTLSGTVVTMADGAGPPYDWVTTIGRLTQCALVCNSTGTHQTLFFTYNIRGIAEFTTLYARTSTDGGVTWGSIVRVSNPDRNDITNVSAHMATSGTNDGVIVDVIWSQQNVENETYETVIGRSINSATSFNTNIIGPGTSTFPHITGSTDGSLGWATMVYNGNVIAFKRSGNAAYVVSPAPSYTSSQSTANWPRISCSGDGQTVAVTYFVGLVNASNRTRPLWCSTTDNAGTSWVETEMSFADEPGTFVTARVTGTNQILDGGHRVRVSGNSLNSGNSNIIYVSWISPEQPSGDGAKNVRIRKRFLGPWDGVSAVVGVADPSSGIFPLQGVEIVSSYNGAVSSCIWSDNVTTVGLQDRPIRYVHTFDGGVNWSSPVTLNTVLDNQRGPNHPLHCSYLGNVTNVFYPLGTDNSGVLDVFDVAYWTRRCIASSNNINVVRDFVPDQNSWLTNGQHVTYTFTLSAFANGDFKLSQFDDQNIMQNATPGGPAKDSTVGLTSLTLLSGVHLGSAAGGSVNQTLDILRYVTPSGNLVWSTTEIPVVIRLNVVFQTSPGSGTTDFFTVPSAWAFGAGWKGTDSFVTYIGATPGRTSSTANLLLSDTICVAEGSRVKLDNGELLSIEQLKEGDLILGENDQTVPVCGLIKLAMPLSCFYKLQNDSSQLLICRNHPIFHGGREVMPQDIGDEVILAKPRSIYTLITRGRQYVQMEGFLVATWSKASWENFVTNDPRGSGLQWSRIA